MCVSNSEPFFFSRPAPPHDHVLHGLRVNPASEYQSAAFLARTFRFVDVYADFWSIRDI